MIKLTSPGNSSLGLTIRLDAGNSLGAGAGTSKGPGSKASEIPVRKRAFNPATHKKCIKCRRARPREEFGDHETSVDGKQSICFECKNARGKMRHQQNVRARLRHHIATRCATQLGKEFPEGFTKDIEQYLGYNLGSLVRELSRKLREEYPDRKLRDVLNEGWHVDHIYPLSRYPVVRGDGSVDWEEFKRCWAPENLKAIPAEDNLKKGAKVIDFPSNTKGKRTGEGEGERMEDPFGLDDEDD